MVTPKSRIRINYCILNSITRIYLHLQYPEMAVQLLVPSETCGTLHISNCNAPLPQHTQASYTREKIQIRTKSLENTLYYNWSPAGVGGMLFFSKHTQYCRIHLSYWLNLLWWQMQSPMLDASYMDLALNLIASINNQSTSQLQFSNYIEII